MAGDIVALGGRGFRAGPEDQLMVDFILSLARGSRPRVCLVPTAGGDAAAQIADFYRACSLQDCRPSDLRLFERTVADLRGFVLEQDVVYVGGGNTASMLAVWRAHGFDEVLHEAHSAGVVLCGTSAGMNCWFEASVTDSFDLASLAPLQDGLGLLSGSACPHYDSEPLRRPSYRALVADGFPAGYAADDATGLHFSGGALREVVTTREGDTGYRVDARGETALRARLL
jgi:dipeptidase E